MTSLVEIRLNGDAHEVREGASVVDLLELDRDLFQLNERLLRRPFQKQVLLL